MTKTQKPWNASQALYGGDRQLELDDRRRRAKQRMGSEQVHNDLYHKFKQENRWTMFGKYYGTPIEQLPQSYLVWVIGNLDGKYRELADKELFRRKSTNT